MTFKSYLNAQPVRDVSGMPPDWDFSLPLPDSTGPGCIALSPVEALERMNRIWSIVTVKGKTRYKRNRSDSREVPYDLNSFRFLMAPIHVELGTAAKPNRVAISGWWLKHPERNDKRPPPGPYDSCLSPLTRPAPRDARAITAEQIAKAKTSVAYQHPHPLHEHDDCIRIAFAWLDAQVKTKNPLRKRVGFKHMIERWAGRYISQSDVEVAAELHPDIRGVYPRFNVSPKLVFPDVARIIGIGEAGQHSTYCPPSIKHNYDLWEHDGQLLKIGRYDVIPYKAPWFQDDRPLFISRVR